MTTFSYPLHIFKQIQAVTSVADRVCLRIFSDGLLYVQVIVGQDLESIFFELKVRIITYIFTHSYNTDCICILGGCL
jgi:hypothetical protein